MTPTKEMFQALHPDPNKKGARVTKAYYDAYRAALLEVVPTTESGVPLASLSTAVQPHIPADILANTSPMWWIMTVKLDLEARQQIERVQIKGRQHIRRLNLHES